jgi:hypothetical protein
MRNTETRTLQVYTLGSPLLLGHDQSIEGRTVVCRLVCVDFAVCFSVGANATTTKNLPSNYEPTIWRHTATHIVELVDCHVQSYS